MNKDNQLYLLDDYTDACDIFLNDNTEIGSTTWLLMDEKRREILALMKPARWIDGAARLPKTGLEIAYKRPLNIGCEVFLMKVGRPLDFEDTWWMLASDYPMILEPEPVVPEIPKCPVCGAECFVGKYGLLFCTGCSYQVATLEQHNDLCRRLK